MLGTIFAFIISLAFLAIFAYVMYYVVGILKSVRNLLNDIEVILRIFRKEQEFINSLIFKSSNMVGNLEDTLKTVDNIVQTIGSIKKGWSAHEAKHKDTISS